MAFAASTATRAFAAPAKLATRSRRTVAVQVRAGRPGRQCRGRRRRRCPPALQQWRA